MFLLRCLFASLVAKGVVLASANSIFSSHVAPNSIVERQSNLFVRSSYSLRQHAARASKRSKRSEARKSSKNSQKPVPSPVDEQPRDFCDFNQEERRVVGRLMIARKANVGLFLGENGDAIPALTSFVASVRAFVGETEWLPTISDRDILLMAMLPDTLPEEEEEDDATQRGLVVIDRSLQQEVDCDDKDKIVAARLTDVLVEVFDLAFALVGLGGGFAAVGKAVGRSIAKRLLAGPAGRRIIRSTISTFNRTGKNPRAIGAILASVIGEVGLNGVLDALGDAPDLSAWDIAEIVGLLAANIAAIGLSNGLVLVLKIVEAGLAALEFYEAIQALLDIEERCPSTPIPTTAPTPMPTFRPTWIPTQMPTLMSTPMQPTLPPSTLQPSPKPTRPTDSTGGGRTSGVFGDPHLSTFDRLRFDCQAAGEFTMLTSLQKPDFRIQERFTSVSSTQCSQASVSTGVAVQDTGLPAIQISIPRESNGSLGEISVGDTRCPVDLFVNGTMYALVDGTKLEDVTISVRGSSVRIFFPFTGVQINPTVQFSPSFGCHLAVQVFIPFDFRPWETLLGLLGTPNGNRQDDWVKPDGTVYGNPTNVEDSIFSPSYEYCTTQWCLKDDNDSIFSYRSDESFETFHRCDETYSSEIEVAIAEAITKGDPLVEICGSNNLVCLIDGLCGDSRDAQSALDEEASLRAAQELSNPTEFPTTAPSESPTKSASSSKPSTNKPTSSKSSARKSSKENVSSRKSGMSESMGNKRGSK